MVIISKHSSCLIHLCECFVNYFHVGRSNKSLFLYLALYVLHVDGGGRLFCKKNVTAIKYKKAIPFIHLVDRWTECCIHSSVNENF